MKRYNTLKNTDIFLPEKNTPSTPIQITKHYHDLYSRVLNAYTPCHKTEREERIILINAHQESLIQSQYQSRVVPSMHDFERKLIAYYRPTQINALARLQIQEIMRFLRYYVEAGYSPVFSEFGVVYRFPQTDSLEEFSPYAYTVTGGDFRALSNIYANTVHFSSGTPEDIPGSISILGTTPYQQHRHRTDVVHLPLEYQRIDPIAQRRVLSPASEKQLQRYIQDPARIIAVLKKVLSTVHATERILIEQSETLTYPSQAPSREYLISASR